MSNQAQIDALEHLVLSLVKNAVREGRMLEGIFDDAHGSVMSEKGPGGTTQKTEAADYLMKHLKFLASK